MPPKSAALDAQKSILVNFDKHWTSLQGALRSVSSIEPFLIDCDQDEDKVEEDAVEHLEGKSTTYNNHIVVQLFSPSNSLH